MSAPDDLLNEWAGIFAGKCMAYHHTDHPWQCLNQAGHEGPCDGVVGHGADGSCCRDPLANPPAGTYGDPRITP